MSSFIWTFQRTVKFINVFRHLIIEIKKSHNAQGCRMHANRVWSSHQWKMNKVIETSFIFERNDDWAYATQRIFADQRMQKNASQAFSDNLWKCALEKESDLKQRCRTWRNDHVFDSSRHNNEIILNCWNQSGQIVCLLDTFFGGFHGNVVL